MNDRFIRMMHAATRSTTHGDLLAATRTIQQALARQTESLQSASDAVNTDNKTIDIPFRDVTPPERTTGNTAFTNQFEASENAAQVFRGVHRAKSGSRRYRLFVPGSGASHQLPMLVMLHGCTQHADDFALGTGMDEIADRHGVIVLYPEQSRQDNANACWNWFQPGHHHRNQGECEILADMALTVAKELNADTSRIFVAGLSAGGAMAAVLSHQYPELFRALGVHSGLPTGQAKDMQSALKLMSRGKTGPKFTETLAMTPTIVFHGTNDQTVHPRNGQDLFDTAIAGFNDENLQLQTETGQTAGRDYTRTSCLQPNGQSLHEYWVVHGAGHAWSGGSLDGTFTDASGPEASSEMIRFFLSQR